MVQKVEIRDKEYYLKLEESLAPYACKNIGDSIARIDPNDPELEGERVPFQLDRDKIIHSRAFRRLMHKTQVLTVSKGDHFRTRLTHTLEVSQIARSMAKLLGLNEELTEAISLGHDLGHTPFGHIGERTLHDIISGGLSSDKLGIGNVDDFRHNSQLRSRRRKKIIKNDGFGGFKHNFQSVHIADNLEQWALDTPGFNLTLAVRDGILKHTGLKNKGIVVRYPELKMLDLTTDVPFTLEGQVVKLADEIAQTTHDLEDGFRIGIIKNEDFIDCSIVDMVCDRVGGLTREVIKTYDIRQLRASFIGPMVGHFIHDSVKATAHNLEVEFPEGIYPPLFEKMLVTFSEPIAQANKQLLDLIRNLYLTSIEVSTMDSRAEHLVKNLFYAYWTNPAQLPNLILSKYFAQKSEVTFSRMKLNDRRSEMQKDPAFARIICDHIASMTDNYAFSEYRKLYLPE